MIARTTRLLLLILSAVLALACGEEAPPEKISARPVVLAGVSVRDLEDRLDVTGQIVARNQAAIAAEVAGRVTELAVDEGDELEAGQLILEIDPEKRELDLRSARAMVAEARAQLDEGERELSRMQTLHDQNIAAKARLEEAQTGAALTRSRLAAAEAKLGVSERAMRDSSVRAPFAGMVARRHVSPGEFVNVGMALVEVVALDPIEIEFNLAERDSARVALGQEVLVRVDPFPDETFGATVTVISPTIDARTRTLRVLARIDDSDGRLRPGLFARADLGVAMRQGVITVPEEAVLQRADGQVIYRLRENDQVQRVLVDTGAHRHGHVEVLGGLEDEDLVVTRGHASLVDGEVVSPRNPDGTVIRRQVADVASPGEAIE
jgi:membrane fusion protein (multidrug efflux system)